MNTITNNQTQEQGQYYISFSFIFGIINHPNGVRKPWVVKKEGSYDTWIFPTEQAARDWVAKQTDGVLAGVDNIEEETFNEYMKKVNAKKAVA